MKRDEKLTTSIRLTARSALVWHRAWVTEKFIFREGEFGSDQEVLTYQNVWGKTYHFSFLIKISRPNSPALEELFMDFFISEIFRPNSFCSTRATNLIFEVPTILKIMSIICLVLFSVMRLRETAFDMVLLFPLETWLVRTCWLSKRSPHIASSSVTSQ